MQNWKKEKDKESKFTEYNNGQKHFQLQKSKLSCQHGHFWEELYAFSAFEKNCTRLGAFENNCTRLGAFEENYAFRCFWEELYAFKCFWEDLYAFKCFCIYIVARSTCLLCHILRPSVSICPFVRLSACISVSSIGRTFLKFNPSNPELNPICHLLALLVHHFLHISRMS
jgi:hypothetical protein